MYEAPIKDLNFVIKNIIDLKKLSEVDDYKEFSDDLVEAVLEEAGKIVTGQSSDTDTVVASAKAYINSLNKIILRRQKKAPKAIAN